MLAPKKVKWRKMMKGRVRGAESRGVEIAFEPQLGPLTARLKATYSTGRNSEILAAGPGYHQLGILTDHNQFFLTPGVIPLVMDNAIVAIEDKRFYEHNGYDLAGMARAVLVFKRSSSAGVTCWG